MERRPFDADRSPQQPASYQAVKVATAVAVGASLLVLSALTLVGTVIGLTVATPLLVIFSPVLVPAGITLLVLMAGFLSSGGFGMAALSVLGWMYQYVTGKQPVGADQLDQARLTLAGKARDIKEHYGPGHHVGGAQAS